ncbi:MAG: hypothetical protein COA70_04115 [Planctomycetota bacterium]|nr:MAG: hypothetical protein COA70_04115 [Planctomycetota bacterium]
MTSKERRKAPVFPRLVLLGLFTASVFSFLGTELVWFSLFSHFQAYLATAWVAILALFRLMPAFPRSFWQPKLVTRAGVLMLLGHGLMIASLYFPVTPPELESPNEVDIIWFNMMYNSDALRELEELIAKDPPDILAFGEIGPHVDIELPGYTFQLRSPKHHLLLVSRLPLEFSKLVQVPGAGREQLSTRVAVGRRRFELSVVHMRQPIYPSHFQEFQVLGETAQKGNDVILIGDFNTTVWSSQFRDFVSDVELHHGREGRGIQNTWSPTFARWAQLPIDHMLYRGSIELQELEAMEWTQSDHRPIRGKFLIGGKLRRKFTRDD